MLRKVTTKSGHGFYPVMENNNNHFGCNDVDRVKLEEAMEERFRWLRIMLQLTGLVFCMEENKLWRFLKILRAAVLITLAFYQTGFVLKVLLDHGQFDLVNSRSLIIFSWLIQALLSMGFIIYFQIRGHLCRLRWTIHCVDGCPLTPKVIKSTIVFYCGFLLFTVFCALAVLFLKCRGMADANSIIDDAIYKMYGSARLLPLTLAVHFWAMYVWVAALSFFICIVTVLQHELCSFNIHKLMKIGEEVEEGDMEGIAKELQECYVRHVELANRIRIINETFEVYTFAMFGSNVPTTIFCILAFLLSYQNSSWLSVAFNVPDLMFCIFELIGLTCASARVHATIRDVESIMYKNMRIWRPYNDKVYRLVSVFIAHANQSNLGITLWGFAVVTKPLILTMLSLTVSYLTFVLQVQPEKSAGGNETLRLTFN